MKKILFIAATNLHERNGGALATLAYYNALKYCYPDLIDLVLPLEYAYGKYSTAIGVPKRTKKETLFDLFHGQFHRLKRFLFQYLSKNHQLYNIAIINGGFYAGDMIKLFQLYKIKTIVIHHNYEPEYHMDNRTLPTLGGLTPYFVIRNEKMAYKNADLNAFLTSTDIELHHKHYGNGKQDPFLLGVFEPSKQDLYPGEKTTSKLKSLNIIITGSLNSVQTIKGIINLKKNYYRILKDIAPKWTLIIAGRNPGQAVYNFMKSNPQKIHIIPNPEDINKIITTGKIFLCPTNVGGGLKLRLMDGLRNGLPILVHQVSARGYESFYNYPFFQIYNNKESFIKGLRNLIELTENKQNYQYEICRIYRSNFSFESGCLRIKDMINKLKDKQK